MGEPEGHLSPVAWLLSNLRPAILSAPVFAFEKYAWRPPYVWKAATLIRKHVPDTKKCNYDCSFRVDEFSCQYCGILSTESSSNLIVLEETLKICSSPRHFVLQRGAWNYVERQGFFLICETLISSPFLCSCHTLARNVLYVDQLWGKTLIYAAEMQILWFTSILFWLSKAVMII